MSSAVSTVRQYGLARTLPIGIPSALIAVPTARASSRPRSTRLRWVGQSSKLFIPASFFVMSVAA